MAIQASELAFAASLSWGHHVCGGDSSSVQQLQHRLHRTQATTGRRVLAVTMPTRCSAASSFAAILENRKVVTWGDPLEGGDSSLTCVDFCECRQCLVHVLFRQDESCLSDATLQCKRVPRGARPCATWRAAPSGLYSLYRLYSY